MLTDGLPNNDPTCQHHGKTTQTQDKSSCNASRVRGFCYALLSAETHLRCYDKLVVV